MFNSLSDRLNNTLRAITGKGRITEDAVKETLREVRIALLEADVALPVVSSFISEVKQRALGQEVISSLKPGEALVKIVQPDAKQTIPWDQFHRVGTCG